MSKVYTIKDIEKTTPGLFGLVYSVVFILFLVNTSLLYFSELKCKHYENSLIAMQKAHSLLMVMEAELKYASESDAKLVFSNHQVSLINLLREADNQLKTMVVPKELKQQFVILREIPSASFSVNQASDKKIKNSDPLTNYKRELRRTTQTVDDELADQKASSKFLMIACILMAGLALGSVPVMSHNFYTKPLQTFAKALVMIDEGRRTGIKTKGFGIVRLFGDLVDTALERQSKSQLLIRHVSEGNFQAAVEVDEEDRYLLSLKEMQCKLQDLSREERNTGWINHNLAKLESILKTESENEQVTRNIIALLSKSVSAGVGVIYGSTTQENESHFFTRATYGLGTNAPLRKINFGQGQLGQLGVEKKTVVLTNVPSGYLVVQSGLGASAPTEIVMVPLIFKGEIYGALEFACFHALEDFEMRWLEKSAESLAAHFFNLGMAEATKKKLQDLADKQAEELVEIHRLQQMTYHKLEVKLQEVEEEKSKNQAILEGCVDGVLSFDEHGSIHFCNKTAAEIFGTATETIKAGKVFDLLNIRLDLEAGVVKPYFLMQQGEKEIGIRTEASVKSFTGDDVDVLITSTKVELQHTSYFTFFIQKISVDLF